MSCLEKFSQFFILSLDERSNSLSFRHFNCKQKQETLKE